MPIQARRLRRRVLEVGFLVVLSREPYLSTQADTCAAALENAPVRRDGADSWGLESLLD